ncbi:VanZ family protein [Sporolactobacillus sp. Y61]|uniref:VanZ family protein n=1 Tax=Sporolactobacillus sp. Y61 TaxID=3160863 RepID=A0AAU8IHA7_9BACL
MKAFLERQGRILRHLLEPDILDFFIGYGTVLGVCLLWEKLTKKHLTFNRGIFLSLLAGYLVFTVLLTVQPVSSGTDTWYQWRPLQTISSSLHSAGGYWLLFWQIVLPIPFIFFTGFATRGRLTFFKLMITGFTASLGVEILVFLLNGIPRFPVHPFDVDDLILNACGVLIGTSAFRILGRQAWMRQYITDIMSWQEDDRKAKAYTGNFIDRK